MRVNDDSDMKIAGEHFEETEEYAESLEAMTRLLEQEKENGNLPRARALGKRLVQTAKEIERSLPLDDHALIVQRWLLLTFAVEVELQRLSPNVLVAEAAHSVFYNALQSDAANIYDELQENGSLSFYYLCVREDDTVDEQKVGETFASLCGHAGDETYTGMGRDLYAGCVKQVEELTAAAGFVR